MSQQTAESGNLAAVLSAQIGFDGQIMEEESVAINKNTHSIFERWIVSHENIINFLFDQGMFIQDTYLQLSIQTQIEVVQMVSKLVMKIIDDISTIQAERDSTNLPAENLPLVLSHKLVKIYGRGSTTIVKAHLSHLEQFWSQEEIDKLEINIAIFSWHINMKSHSDQLLINAIIKLHFNQVGQLLVM